jgi:SRSO17 transposase
MAIPKSGEKSVGVARQWCGATGKVDNCQVTVNCTIARAGEQHNSDQVTWPLGTRLYLPKKWTGEDDSVYDTAREREKYARLSREAGIPEEVSYQPKYEIAVDLIEQAMAADPDHACVVGDTGFGKYPSFRKELRARNEPYVLEVETSKFVVVPEETTVLEPGSTSGRGRPRKHPAYPEEVDAATPEQIADRLEKQDDWREVTWNEGTKGELSGEFSRTRVRVVEDRNNRWLTEETGWLLLKRPSGEEGEGELKAWICWGLDKASLKELVSWGQLRWTVERFHQDIKQELGADKYQGRTWRGFHHHLSAVMLAHAFIAEQRLKAQRGREDLASFGEVVRQIVRESAVQRLMENHGFDRAKAREVAVDMLREYSDW